MAYFSRLIAALLLIASTFNCAYAALTPTYIYKVYRDGVGYPGGSPTQAAQSMWTSLFPNSSYQGASCDNLGGSSGMCTIYADGGNAQYGWVRELTCPANSEKVGEVCVCKSGFVEVDGSCKPPPPQCSENQEVDSETNTCVCKTGPAGAFSVAGDVYTGCNNGCTIVLSSGSYSGTTKKTYGNWNQNGNTCSPAPDTPGVDSPDSPDGQDAGKCPTGQCPGTFNGQFMCVPCKGKESSDSSSSENTTETPNGASAPSGSSSESSSGSKSTECEGGVCITKEKVVVTNPDGSTTEKQKETTESMSEFCAKNPKAAICKAVEDGRWGGSCSGGFQCSGDAVQCAQAQAAWKSACAADVSGMSDQINIGSSAMAAGAASGLGIPGGSDAFDLGSRLSEVPLFGSSGGCPSDVSVNVGGTSYTIAFSAMCGQLQVLGVALMGFAYLIAGFIVFRGDRS